MANRRYIDFPIASSVGDSDIILIWQSGANKQTTKATFLSGLPENLDELNDVAISGLTNGQILRYDSVTGKWENTDQGNLDLNDLNDVQIVSPSNGQVLVYNSSTSKWENSSGGYVPYTGAVTTVNLGAQTIQAGSFVKAGGTAAQFLKANGSVDSTAYGTGSVTSVALTMPSAFSVANSPITTAGTLAVTGAGTVGQYIRGDGSLADFPESSGGGSSVSYYLNGSVAQGTIGGVAYKELNKVPILGAGTDFTINADGYIASFITDAGDPNLLEIPAGNWNFETYFSASSNGGSPSFYVELYKYDGTTFTLIATSSSAPELIAFGTSLNPYYSTLAVPQTTLALTDRLAIRYYVTHSGRTITLHTEDNHLCQIITTFTTGLTALNGLTAQIQNFAVGTSGTDFAIASATATHTFNLPTASATNRGALSSADWTTFNNKTSNLGTVTSVGLSSATSGVTIGSTPVTTSGTITLAIATASGSQNGLLSSTDWTTFNSKQNALTNPVTGTGTTNYLPKFTGASTIGNSPLYDASGSVGLNTLTPALNGFNRELTVSAGVSGTARAAINIQGSRTTSSTFGALGFFHQTNYVAGIESSRGGEDNSGILQFFTSNAGTIAERLQINSSGNLLVGTTTDNGARLQVSGVSASSALSLRNTTGGTLADFIITENTGLIVNSYESASARSIDFRVANSSALLIASTGAATFSSSVGIGGVTPTSRLDVAKSASDTLSRANSAMAIGDFAFGAGLMLQQRFSAPYGFMMQATNSTVDTFYPLLLNPNGGNVGIGISTGILSKLTVSSSTKGIGVNESNLQIQSNESLAANIGGSLGFGATSDYGIVTLAKVGGYRENATGTSVSSYLSFETRSGTGANTEKMRITSGGNVGIGTTVEAGRLNINSTNSGGDSTALSLMNRGTANNTAVQISFRGLTAGGSENDYGYIKMVQTNTSTPASELSFWTQSGSVAERMRITSGGNVLIGTQTNGASKLRIVGLPTSAVGLSSGDVYNLSGVLMIA